MISPRQAVNILECLRDGDHGLSGERSSRRTGGRTICCGLLLLAGCNLAPDYSQPPLPVSRTFGPDAADGALPSVSAKTWGEFFPDDTLKKLIAAALAANQDLAAAAARVEEARYTVAVRGAALFPQVSMMANGGQVQLGRIKGLSGASGFDDTPKFFSGMLAANWEIDFWGRIRNMRESARQSYLASQQARRAVATSLVGEVATAYLADRAYGDRIVLAEKTITTWKDSLRIVTRRYEVGTGARIDVAQAEAQLTSAIQAVESLRQEREQNLNALTLLAGGPVSLPDGGLTFSDSYLSHPLPAGLPSDLLLNRPDIMEAEHDLRATDADIGTARAAFLPRVIVTGAGGTASSDFNALFGGGSGTWSFLPVISLPIFSGFRNVGNLKLAEAERKEAVANYEHTIQVAFRDVGNALVARRHLALRIDAAKRQLAALEERARLARLRYETGYAAYLEVLEAQRDQFETEQEIVQLHQAYLASGIDLYEAVGGGFPTGGKLTPQQAGGARMASDIARDIASDEGRGNRPAQQRSSAQ